MRIGRRELTRYMRLRCTGAAGCVGRRRQQASAVVRRGGAREPSAFRFSKPLQRICFPREAIQDSSRDSASTASAGQIVGYSARHAVDCARPAAAFSQSSLLRSSAKPQEPSPASSPDWGKSTRVERTRIRPNSALRSSADARPHRRPPEARRSRRKPSQAPARPKGQHSP